VNESDIPFFDFLFGARLIVTLSVGLAYNIEIIFRDYMRITPEEMITFILQSNDVSKI
jgi:hypothetical protein